MSLLGELKRRNVFRVATFYVVAGWVLLQAGSLLFETLGVPAWALKLLLALLLLGFPFVIVFAWVYELTPEGLKREHEVAPDASITARTAAKLNVLIVCLLVVAIGIGALNWWQERGSSGRAGITGAGNETPALASGAIPGDAPTAVRSTRSAAGEPASTGVSIAVLPFLNMSDEKANEYFSDGLTEELLNVLANVQGLRVIARTSSFAYKGKDVKIADVAHDLDVDHVLEGSVRKSGNTVRITTQLIRASDSSHLWSETYDRNLKDIFAVQDEISQHVVEALKVKLLPQDVGASEVGSTTNPAAYEAFLMGRHLFAAGEAENTLRGALRSLDEAIRLDPEYAQAYASKAQVLGRIASNGYDPFDTGFKNSKTAAQRALEIAPDLAEGYLALGLADTILSGNANAANSALNRAIELNPGNTLVQQAYGQAASSHGDHDAAIRAGKTAVALDPLSPQAYSNLAGIYGNARRYAEAEGAARRALSLAPHRPGTPQQLGYALLLQDRFDEALEAFNDEPVDWSRRNGRCLVLARSGKTNEARRELAEFQSRFGDLASYQYAGIEAQLGDKDAAMRWLLNARRVHDPGLVTGALSDPLLDPLHGDPRFEKLLLDLGYVKRS